MASRKLSDLIPECETKAEQVIQICEENGVDILIHCTLRSLQEQAKLYRQSRRYFTITAKINKFRLRDFGFLADILFDVGPQNGPHVTYAAPGESWHNYAEAFDSVPLIGGKPGWNKKRYLQEWNIYGNAIRTVYMNWSGDWKRFKEFPHAQMRKGSNPLKVLGAEEIRNILIRNKLL